MISDTIDRAATTGLDEGDDPDHVQEVRDEIINAFLHLKNVRIFQVGAFHKFRGAYWRGKVSEVDGFWLGRSAQDE